MIRGYYSTVGAVRRPFLFCSLEFPKHPNVGASGVELLVDTGADRTILSPIDAESIGIVKYIAPINTEGESQWI